jgi:integrase
MLPKREYMRLTAPNAAKIKLGSGKSEVIVFDDALRGFGLRVRAGGKRTWIVQYRVGSKQRRVSLGSVESLDADEARKAAKATLAKVHLGADPQIEKAEARARASATLGAFVDGYLERAKQRLRPRSFLEFQRHLLQQWAPLHRLPIHTIQRLHIATRLSQIAQDSGPFAANTARVTLSAFFKWAMGEGLVENNPVIGTNRPAENVARERVLTNDELRLVWRTAGNGEYGAIVRLLILTGQRREEVGGMLWQEIDLDKALWSIGSERSKNSLAHDVPLSAAAIAVIQEIPNREGRELVFGSRSGPFQGWSKAKAALDQRMAALLEPTTPWRLHDIRRTVATRMADLGVLPHVIEAVLNHISGHKAGVAGVYNRATYAAEKQKALELWSEHVSSVIQDRHED